ncbi:MAG: OmpA family protein [Sandaracinaceae bacterium]|nr:OmpA family protein [Sandaracinaceae bacterium]
MPSCPGAADTVRLLLCSLVCVALGCGPATASATETTPEQRSVPADPATDPRADPDADGIPNEADACPCDAEDVDGFADDDGCPDPDNDDDGVHDACDQCPFLPETYLNGGEPDGCPDTGRIELPPPPLRIAELIRFRPRSAVIASGELERLDAVVAVLQSHLEARVGVHGHADRSEAERLPLSERRARAVHDALVARGIAPERLSVRGHGSDEPYRPGRSATAQRDNRRVEFEVEHEEPPPLTPEPTRRATPEDCQPPAPSAC